HRLDFWPDSVGGIGRLRGRYVGAALSNGNVALLVNMARNAGLAWDCVLSAELTRRYKPEPDVYLTAAALLGLEPHEVMMVAAHNNDLRAAQRVGFRTAFVLRATEYGEGQDKDLEADPSVDVAAADFNDLADKLIGATHDRIEQ
ncbi:MAG: haloacid dehalogenase, partial [Dehalococcoidia bacterium]|nr:haloacid dehalogenase [Dehalococcoidia bacterium]